MTKFRDNRQGPIRLIAVVLFLCVAASGFLSPFADSNTSGAVLVPTPTPPAKRPAKSPAQPKQTNFTDFSHGLPRHGKLACGSCHKLPTANWKRVRKDGEAFPDVADYPKHESCLSCHRPQFFGSARPTICSICHTNPSPRDGARHPFPNPREIFDRSPKGKQAVSDFAISFPHDKHIEIVAQGETRGGAPQNVSFKRKRAGEESCAVCHRTLNPQGKSDDEFVTRPPAKPDDDFWLKKGTFKSVPIGHATCFTCHSADAGIPPAPSACAACHKPAPTAPAADFDAKLAAQTGDLDKTTLLAWRSRDSSGKFRHELASHAELECATCHNAAAIDTTDFSSKKVPVASCSLCHITETSDDGGILNFEIDSRKKDAGFQCVKCHVSFGRRPVPESHFKAVAALSGK